MKIDTRALGLTMGLIWGGAVLLVGVLNVLSDGGYGAAFLGGVSSVYPGYQVGGIGSVVIGTAWATVDGFIGGLVVAWLYNKLARGSAS